MQWPMGAPHWSMTRDCRCRLAGAVDRWWLMIVAIQGRYRDWMMGIPGLEKLRCINESCIFLGEGSRRENQKTRKPWYCVVQLGEATPTSTPLVVILKMKSDSGMTQLGRGEDL